MMKSVRMISAALALSGLFAAPLFAQQGTVPSYQSSRFNQPALLQDAAAQPAGEVQQTTGYTISARGGAPQANIVSLTPVNADEPAKAPEQQPAAPGTGSCTTGGCTTSCTSTGCTAGCTGPGSLYDAAVNGNCGDYCCSPCNWNVYVGGVFMGRDSGNKKWTTYETGNNANQLMYFRDADWSGGGELRVGKYFGGCGCNDCTNMIEGVYYGVYGMNSFDSLNSPTDQLSSPIDLGFVNYGTGVTAASLIDNAREHRVWRESDFQNAELNWVHYLIGSGAYNGCGNSLTVATVTGFRYMRFDDYVLFGASSAGNEFGTDPAEEAYFDSGVANNLYGWQIGALITHNCSQNFSMFARPMVGVFANEIDFRATGYRGDGVVATFTSTGNAFDLSNSKTDVSFMGQLDLGVNYKCGCHWTLTAGYRVIGLAGVALADDQVPAYLAAEGDWTDIDSSSSVIIHGLFGGVTYAW